VPELRVSESFDRGGNVKNNALHFFYQSNWAGGGDQGAKEHQCPVNAELGI
jgi:hypothetical protein